MSPESSIRISPDEGNHKISLKGWNTKNLIKFAEEIKFRKLYSEKKINKVASSWDILNENNCDSIRYNFLLSQLLGNEQSQLLQKHTSQKSLEYKTNQIKEVMNQMAAKINAPSIWKDKNISKESFENYNPHSSDILDVSESICHYQPHTTKHNTKWVDFSSKIIPNWLMKQ